MTRNRRESSPYSVEAEAGVVASLLLDPGLWEVVAAIVEPRDFYSPAHRTVFVAMGRLIRADKPFDLTQVIDALRTAGDLDAIGGVEFLTDLYELLPVAFNAGAYADTVRQHAIRRRTIDLGLDLAARVSNGEDVAAVLNDVREQAQDLATARIGDARGFGSRPVVLNMADVTAEAIEWLWPGRIPLGMLTLIAGDPGLGKSFLSMDLAARVSIGSVWPDDVRTRAPLGGVVILNAEDDVARVVRPRLDRAGADVSRINFVAAVRDQGAENDRQLDLSRDLAALEAAIVQTKDCKLAIIDPLSSYIGGIDAHRSNDVRGVVDPLAKLAARRGVALLCVTHLNKGGGGGPAIYRATGSLAFIAAARAGFYVCRDKDRPERRLLLPAKVNLAPDTLGMAYEIIDGALAWERDPVSMTADDALAQAASNGEERGERREAVDWLSDVLAGGPVAAKELQRLANDAGLAWPTVKRAKDELGVASQRSGFGKGSTCYWELPAARDGATLPIGRTIGAIESEPGVLNSMDSMANGEVQTWSA